MATGTALIFEGGGMRGTYTAALVAAMIESGVEVPWVGGISAGATHTANFLARDAWRARACFVELAKDPKIGGPISFIRGKGYFNSDYIYHQTTAPGELLRYNWEAYSASSTPFKIGSFDCATGKTVYWGRDDVRDNSDFTTRCQASSSIPIAMPMVQLDGTAYLDGAIGETGGFAVDAARADGYERFLVVMTRPRGYRKGPVRAPAAIYQKIFKKYPAVVEAILRRPKRYNATLDELEELQAEGKAYLYYPETMPVSNGERNAVRIQAAYEEGMQQARRDLPAIKEFLAG